MPAPEKTENNISSNRRRLLAVALLVVTVLAVFGRVGGHEFLTWDDRQHIHGNPHLNPVSWRGLAGIWAEPYWGLYVPASYTFFAAEALIAQRPLPGGVGYSFDPMVFHLGNLALHVACVLLVFSVLRRLFRHDGAACAGALLFALHPAQVESVAWISETRGVLCAMFCLLAVWFCVRPVATAESRTSAAICYAAATAAFLLALLSKPAAAVLPLMIGTIEIALLHRPAWRVLLRMGPWLVASAGWIILTKSQQPDTLLWFVPPLWARGLLAGDALAFYAYKLLAPLQFGPDYGRTPAWVMGQWWFYVAWLLPAALLGALAAAPGRRLWLTAAALFVICLLPVLGFVAFDFQRISSVADRYLYLAMLGPAVALSGILAARWNRCSVAAAGGVLCLLGIFSFVQVSHWHDDNTLFVHAGRINPDSVMANHNLGFALARQGRFVEATARYLKVLDVDPHHAESQLGLGVALLELGNLEQAEKHLRKAARLKPDWALPHYHLARVMDARDRHGDATQSYRRALRLAEDGDPDFARSVRKILDERLKAPNK